MKAGNDLLDVIGQAGDVRRVRIAVPEERLVDLLDRVRAARVPPAQRGASWESGADPAFLERLRAYWLDGYDWRAHERRLNEFDHYLAPIEGRDLHFLHIRGRGPDPLPILLPHGWPSTFLEMLRLIPLLTDGAESFDVVVPSLPGFGFSDPSDEPGYNFARVADDLHTLMTKQLGYDRFGLHGGDIGAATSGYLALNHGESVVGVHLLDFAAPAPDLAPPAPPLSDAERDYLDRRLAWSRSLGAYQIIQGTKPLKLAYALNDSPLGLAAWLVEKYVAWSDTEDVLDSFSLDYLITTVCLYWFGESISPSMYYYYEHARTSPPDPGSRLVPPTGVAVTPDRPLHPQRRAPREWLDRMHHVTQWRELSHGGHFASWEAPDEIAEALRDFFRPLR